MGGEANPDHESIYLISLQYVSDRYIIVLSLEQQVIGRRFFVRSRIRYAINHMEIRSGDIYDECFWITDSDVELHVIGTLPY